MQWMAPTTGIAMCPISTALEERGESAYGYKQTSGRPKSKSALPPKADIPRPTLDFRFLTQLGHSAHRIIRLDQALQTS
jgi:hypothetical protein